MFQEKHGGQKEGIRITCCSRASRSVLSSVSLLADKLMEVLKSSRRFCMLPAVM